MNIRIVLLTHAVAGLAVFMSSQLMRGDELTENDRIVRLKSAGFVIYCDGDGRPVGASSKGKPINDHDADLLSRLQSIERLYLDSSRLTNVGMSYLTRLPQLTHLSLDSGQIDARAAGHLGQMTRLWSLNLARTKISDADMRELRKLVRLRLLDLSQTQVGDQGIRELSTLTDLVNLKLEDTYVGNAGLATIRHWPKLESFDLSGTKVTDRGIKQLEDLEHLCDLDLSDTSITDIALKQLVDLRCANTIASLYLERVRGITLEGIEHLAKIKNLSDLKLAGVKLDGAQTMELVSKMPRVSLLSIDAKVLSESDLDDLNNLRILIVKGTKVPRDLVTRVRKRFPKLHVEVHDARPVPPFLRLPVGSSSRQIEIPFDERWFDGN